MTAVDSGTPLGGTASAAPVERRSELDAIRLLVVVGLVFFHAGLVFDAEDDFYVQNAETTGLVRVVAGLGVVWAMPMLFLVAGVGAWYSLRRRGVGGFALERLRRLGVPLLFAVVALLPLPQWLRQRSDPAYDEPYPRFWLRFFDVHLAPREFPFVVQGRYFETGHLWFVVLLLTFSLLLAALVRWVPRGAGRRLRDGLAAALTGRRGAVLLPALPLALVCALHGLEEEYAAWSRWAYLLFFLCGFALAADGRLRAAMRRDAVTAAALGLLLFLASGPALLGAGGADDADPFLDLTPLAILGRALYGAAGWCWLVAILGLLDRRTRPARPDAADPGPADTVSTDTALADKTPSGRVLAGSRAAASGRLRRLYRELAAAALPLYILHQPIVVAVAYGVVGWNAPIPVEYAVIVAASLILTVAAYELLVRPTPVTRFLFGLRPPAPSAGAARRQER